ncbi:hypothetical protein AB4527_18520, partial [Vibrio breoganii]
GSSIHIKVLINEMKKKEINQNILLIDLSGKKSINSNCSKVYSFKSITSNKYMLIFQRYLLIVYFFLKEINNKYDVISIHFLGYVTPLQSYLLKKKTNKLIAIFWGSDLYRCTNFVRLNRTLNRCDAFHVSTNDMKMTLQNVLNIKNRNKSILVNRFGVSGLNYIDELNEGFSYNVEIEDVIELKNKGKNIITVGYNAYEGQQHEKIIDALTLCNLNDDTYIVLPMTYGGNDKYKTLVMEKIKKSKLKHLIILNYLDGENFAKLVKETNVFIQLQISDAFSAAMQENIYAGNYVITGDWLPYDEFIEMGITLRQISNFKEIASCFKDGLPKLDETEILKNKELIYKLSSWKNVVAGWNEL